jgi:hypothetical protein
VTDRPAGTGRAWTLGGASLFLIFGYLPIANWIHGGRDSPHYATDLQHWVAGTAIALGAALVYVIVARRVPHLWRDDALAPAISFWLRRPRASTLIIVATALLAYAVVARLVFDGRPLLVDEVTQLFQARQFAHGRLAATRDSVPELFSALELVEHDGRVFAQFPPGGPAVLALGVLTGATWLVVPVCGALAVGCFAGFVRYVEAERGGVSLLATILFAFAPFMLFMSGSQMNHVPALFGICAALSGFARASTCDTSRARRAWYSFLGGAALGFAATIRPVDAMAFALPIAVMLLHRASSDRRALRAVVAAGLGIAGPLAAMLWFNARTTGSPLRFGYDALWGSRHGLGFHAAPWGPEHTVARGLELVSLYGLRLQDFLFETPIPSLTAGVVALLIASRLRPMDRVLFAASGLLVLSYFAYWHDGFYLGPRFFTCLLPLLALWTARLYAEWRERWGREHSYRLLVVASVVSGFFAAAITVPARAREYASLAPAMRWNVDSAARAAGVHDAIVLVRESWGAQLLARLWALGVDPGEAGSLYLGTDACVLERAIDSLERIHARGEPARRMLLPLARDSARVAPSPFSSDTTERVLPGAVYGPRCVQRIGEDRAGYTTFLPSILAGDDRVVYARDLHARDSLLLERFPSREVYLLRPSSDHAGEVPRFWRLARDSLRSAWGMDGSPWDGARRVDGSP